jgi:outer membrane murein-binding lipoprotein Lpp
MKTTTQFLFIASTLLLHGCSKNEKVSKPPVEERVSEDPQTRYGKAIKQTEELTQKIEADRAESDAILDE